MASLQEAVRAWEARFAPLPSEQLRARRRGKADRSWYADDTYIKVHGRWCYLYRCIERDGNLVDAMLGETRDLEAATRFFARAIRRPRGKVQHRCSRYLDSRVGQDHRAIQQRYYPMRGFGTFAVAARFCLAHDELRDYLRPRATMGGHVSLSVQRRIFQERWEALVSDLGAA